MSSKVKLVNFSKKYITQDYIGWLNNPELLKYSEQRHYNHSYETCLKYYKSFDGTSNIFNAVLDISSNEHVGNITAIVDKNNNVADIAILIAKGNCGYGFSAWSEMIKKLFNEKKIRKITAGTMAINYPMVKIFIKSNMLKEYVKIKQFNFNGKLIDLVGYCLFNENLS